LLPAGGLSAPCQNVDSMAIRSLAWIKSPRWQIAGIGCGIAVLAILPWFTPADDALAHNVLHHLNFLPLMVAGMLFGWRGASVAMLFAACSQSPYLLSHWTLNPLDSSDQVLELSIFGVAGLIAGFLSDRERNQRANLERTKAQLETVYQELQQNIDRLRKAERLYAAGQLSASLAHEIRNPLASISGAAGILKRGNASHQNVQDCLDIIEKESNRLNKLLTNFLDFARPRAPRFQKIDIRSLIDSVSALSAHGSSFHSIKLHKELQRDIPEIDCDPEQLKQVLLNLLLNAAQASPDTGSVWIKATASKERVFISVRDEGTGISPEQSEQIFDPFFTTKKDGTGLGLAIASMIIEQHGGTLTAESNSTRGMTFRLELPILRARAA
jgi:two-component system, NtrC family, sensor histidine kinase HydH